MPCLLKQKQVPMSVFTKSWKLVYWSIEQDKNKNDILNYPHNIIYQLFFLISLVFIPYNNFFPHIFTRDEEFPLHREPPATLLDIHLHHVRQKLEVLWAEEAVISLCQTDSFGWVGQIFFHWIQILWIFNGGRRGVEILRIYDGGKYFLFLV